MASKGQKFNKYTIELRNEIVEKYYRGISNRQLAKEYNIPIKTIKNWEYKLKNLDRFPGLGRKRTGRPKEKDLSKEDWKERYEIIKKYQAFLKAQRERK